MLVKIKYRHYGEIKEYDYHNVVEILQNESGFILELKDDPDFKIFMHKFVFEMKVFNDDHEE